MDNPAINVNSEIGKLKTVLLKRPGAEVENITPDTMERLLFDDIPFLKIAQKEHDYFAETLRKNGVETLYIDDLAVEALSQGPAIKERFYVAVNYQKQDQKDLHKVHVAEMKQYLAEKQFANGSMKPKVQVAVSFVESANRPAVITSLNNIASYLDNGDGTVILPD